MGLFDFATDLFGDLFSNTVADLSGGFLAGVSNNLTTGLPVSYPVYQPEYPVFSEPIPTAAGSVPMAARAAAAGIAAWSVRYPALWQAIQQLRARGSRATIQQLWTMTKKWGPTAMTGVIGAAAVSDLISYRMTHKARRMNPANTKALRRSMRRLKSFDRLASRVSMQLSRAGGSRRRKTSARCSSCKRSPCAC